MCANRLTKLHSESECTCAPVVRFLRRVLTADFLRSAVPRHVWMFQTLLQGPTANIAGCMLAAGEIGLLRSLLPHTFAHLALRDKSVMSELAKVMEPNHGLFYEAGDYSYCRIDSMMLQARALEVLVQDSEVNADDLRAWLPRPDELIFIAEHEFRFAGIMSGAAHPALACATLYATRLGAWDDAEAIANGLISIPPLGDGKCFGIDPLARIEAYRLLARCKGTKGNAAGARELLESAVSESQAVGYVWMEAKSLRDMLDWVEGDEEASRCVQERIDTATAKFHVR